VEGNSDAVGLAVIMHNTYQKAGDSYEPLDTNRDGRAMQDAFGSLNFATVLSKDVKRKTKWKLLLLQLLASMNSPRGIKPSLFTFLATVIRTA
jgi:hypothetical protein